MARPKGFNQYMEFDRGFHGWLTFFFVTSCIGLLVRVYALVQTGRVLPAVVAHVDDLVIVGAATAQFAIELALVVAMVYGIRLFLNEDRRTPTYWSVFCLMSIPAVLATTACLALETAHTERSDFATAFWFLLRSGPLRGMAVSLIWALYWTRSKRVLLTYGATAFAVQRDATFEPAAG